MIDDGQRACEYSLLLVNFDMHRRKGSRKMPLCFLFSIIMALHLDNCDFHEQNLTKYLRYSNIAFARQQENDELTT